MKEFLLADGILVKFLLDQRKVRENKRVKYEKRKKIELQKRKTRKGTGNC